ncbi:MAG: protein phosphatase 2C domain-containing protein [Ruminococcus sp.]|nr:protein phosphatase 2C domain-containing protein [Ruminococcus sp.]
MKNWKHSFYLQTGLLHSTCQDFVDIYEDDRCIVSCLCDGLGSLNNSEIAAQTTVKSVIELLKSVEPALNKSVSSAQMKQFKEKLIAEIQDRLNRAATENEISLNSMDSTLLFVLVSKKQGYALIGNLGDSAICVIRSEQSQLYCDSAFIGTRAVLDEDAAEHLHCDLIPLDDSVLGFVLTSDGLENEIYFKGLSFVGKNTELYINALLTEDPKAKLEQLVKTLTTEPDTIFDDDISVAVISCTDKPVKLEDEPTWPCVCGTDNPMCETFCTACSRDFLDLYSHIDFKGDKTAFFRNLQHNPSAKESLVQSLKRADKSASANPFANQAQQSNAFPPANKTVNANPAQRPPANYPPNAYRTQPPQRPPQNQPVYGAHQQQRPAAQQIPRNQSARPAQQRSAGNDKNNLMLLILVVGLVIGIAFGGMVMLLLFKSCGSEEPEPAAPEVATYATAPVPAEPVPTQPSTAVSAEASTAQPTQGTTVAEEQQDDQQDEDNEGNGDNAENENNENDSPIYYS